MNDDRKFQERAETMKELFLAGIPADVIAKIVGLSEATVINDRARVCRLYGIDIPRVDTNTAKTQRFNMLFKVRLEGQLHTPLFRAAKLVIDFNRIEEFIYSIQCFWNNLQMPFFNPTSPYAQNYKELIEKCYTISRRNFVSEFYEAIRNGNIPYDSLNSENNVITLAIKYFSSNHREELTSYEITNPEEFFKPLFSSLDTREYTLLASSYGLGCEKKSLAELATIYQISRERVRQIVEKTIKTISSKLNNELSYLISSYTRLNNLEKENEELKDKYSTLANNTDKTIAELRTENQLLLKKLKDANIPIAICTDAKSTPTVEFLLSKLTDLNLPHEISSKMYSHELKYVVDVVESLDYLDRFRGIGVRTKSKLIDFFEKYGFPVPDIKEEEIALARRIVERNGI